MVGVNAVKLVKEVVCEVVMWRSDNLKEQVFIIMRLKEHFIKYKAPGACMVCAPQSKVFPALYSPKPWGHREWVYSSAFLKMLSLAVASKEEKSAFYYCLILVSLVCKFSVVSLNWTRRSLWIDLLLWKTELEASLKSGSLGNSQPPQLTSGKMDSRLSLLSLPKTDSGTYHVQRHIMVVQPRVHRHTKVHVPSHQTQRLQWKLYCTRGKIRFLAW